MRYRFVLATQDMDLVLSVTPLPEGAASATLPENVLSFQIVEDWFPRAYFYDLLLRSFPDAEIEEMGTALRATWGDALTSLEEIITCLNRVASPGRWGRVGHSYLDVIGETPLVSVDRLAKDCHAKVLVKLESMEPGSVKDRPVARMVKEAVTRGDIGPKTEVVEASSGNLAFALSAILGVLCGRKPTIFMSKMHGAPKRRAVRISGSRIVLTSAEEGTRSAKQAAVNYAAKQDDVFETNQHGNPDNPEAHRETTGPEIYHQACLVAGRPPDEVVCSLGSGGTAAGIARFRDDIAASFRVIGVEPEGANLLSGGEFSSHHFSGMAPGWITDILKVDKDRLDEIVTVSEEEAFAACRGILIQEGFLVGPSSGASIAVALRRARLPGNEGKVIVAFAHDRGDRYLDMQDLFAPPADATEKELEELG